jgi:hypothetical protein
LLPNISISGDAGLLAPQLGLDAIAPVDVSLINSEASSGGLNIDLSPVNVATPEGGPGGLINVGDTLGGVGGGAGGEGGLRLLSLDSEADAAINVPVFGEAGVLAGSSSVGGVIDGGEDGRPLISLDGETEAAINVPILGRDGPLGGETGGGGLLDIGGLLGDCSGPADVGSLLNAAMLGVGNSGSFSAMTGGEAYDSNVAIAGNLNSALGSTLDLLTTTTSLFDVPALDVLGGDGLDG